MYTLPDQYGFIPDFSSLPPSAIEQASPPAGARLFLRVINVGLAPADQEKIKNLVSIGITKFSAKLHCSMTPFCQPHELSYASLVHNSIRSAGTRLDYGHTHYIS